MQVDTVQKGKNNITVESPVASEILQETPCNRIPEELLPCQKQIPSLTFPAGETFQTLGSICPFGLLHPTAHRPHPHTPGRTQRSLLLLYFNPSLCPVPPFPSSSKSLLPSTPVAELPMRMRSDPCPLKECPKPTVLPGPLMARRRQRRRNGAASHSHLPEQPEEASIVSHGS